MSTPIRLVVPLALYRDMVNHAVRELPNECCGLLAGRFETDRPDDVPLGRVVDRFELINEANSPVEYLSDGLSMLRADKAMRERGLDLLAVYHSHPTTDPIPSKTDLARNYYSDAMSFIISLKSGMPLVKGWWLYKDSFSEADWEII